tara:strand:- start:114 stop:257 length:144 start_codon:yes stop_codon:yes gene_type:complete
MLAIESTIIDKATGTCLSELDKGTCSLNLILEFARFEAIGFIKIGLI